MIGKKIKTLRIQKNISQEQLAEIIQVSRQTIYKWEASISQPSADALKRLSNFFDCSIDYFFDGEESTIEENTQKKDSDIFVFKKILSIFFIQIIVIFIILVLAQFIPAYKEITLENQIVTNIALETNEIIDSITTYVEATGLLAFLATYRLRIPFVILVFDTILNLFIIIKYRRCLL